MFSDFGNCDLNLASNAVKANPSLHFHESIVYRVTGITEITKIPTEITEITIEITEITMEITEITIKGWGGVGERLGWIRIGQGWVRGRLLGRGEIS